MTDVYKDIELKEPIKVTELDPCFKYEIAKTDEGRTILYCYQCGTCSSSCQSGCADLYPHQIIRMALLGLKKEVLNSKSIWICTTCYDCIERCPQGVEVANVLFSIKNIAVKEKIMPKEFSIFAKNILNSGRGAEITDIQDDERDDLDLPPVPEVNKEDIKKMLKKVEFDKLIEFEGEDEK